MLDESSRYALAAVNESNRESERPNDYQTGGGEAYFINGLSQSNVKDEKKKKKSKIVKETS